MSSCHRHLILVVDDNPDARDALAMLLELNGATTLVAPDGARALELLRTTTPCLIFLDLHMPGMDGSEFARVLQADPVLSGMPLVLMSGDATVHRLAQELGAAAGILKGEEIDEMISLIERICQRAEPAAQSRARDEAVDVSLSERGAVHQGLRPKRPPD